MSVDQDIKANDAHEDNINKSDLQAEIIKNEPVGDLSPIEEKEKKGQGSNYKNVQERSPEQEMLEEMAKELERLRKENEELKKQPLV